MLLLCCLTYLAATFPYSFFNRMLPYFGHVAALIPCREQQSQGAWSSSHDTLVITDLLTANWAGN